MRRRFAIVAVAAAGGVVAASWFFGRDDRESESRTPEQTSRVEERHSFVRGSEPVNKSRLEGVVRSETTSGKPVPRALVCAVRDADGSGGQVQPNVLCARADERGNFAMQVTAPARYNLHASAAGFYQAVTQTASLRDVQIEQDRDITGVVVVLSRGGHVVSGTVMDILGGEIEGAHVECTYPSNASCLAITGGGGSFKVVLPIKKATIRISADGYAHQDLEVWASPVAVSVMLEPGITLHGSVYDRGTKQPIKGASVKLENIEAGDKFSVVVSSDDNGNWHAQDLRPGRYRPEAFTKAQEAFFGRAEESLVLRPGESREGIKIWVDKTPAVLGRLVTRSSGEPLSDVHISLIDADGRRVTDGRTDALGNVTFYHLSPGMYQVDMQAVGFIQPEVPYTISVAPVGRPSHAHVWSVDTGAAIAGTAVDQEGNPVSDAVIYVASIDGGEQKADQTSVDGTFNVSGLQGGIYSVTGRHKALSSDEQSVEVKKNGIKDATLLRFFSSAAITGVVSNGDDLPIPRAAVSAYATQTLEARTITASTDGKFEIAGLRPDRYRIVAAAPGSGLDSSRASTQEGVAEVDLKSGDSISVQLKLPLKVGSLRGRVFDAQGEPAADSIIILHSIGEGIERRTISDSAGGFQFPSVLEGRHRVTAYFDGLGQATAESTSLDAEVVLRVEGYGRLCGEVKATSDAPSAFRVRLASKAGRIKLEESFTNDKGLWCIGQVQTGEYKVTVYASGKSSEKTAVVSRDKTTQIQFGL